MSFFSKIFGGNSTTNLAKKNKSIFKIDRLQQDELSEHPDLIKNIVRRKIDGVIVENVFSQEEIAAAIARIESWETNVIDPNGFGKVYGKTLTGSNDDLVYYFSETEDFTANLARIFGAPFEKRVESIFKQMAGDRRVAVPTYEGRGHYKPATIRFIEPGKDGMRAHIGNEFITGLPQCAHISEQVQLLDQLSYFVLLQTPDSGGELILYDLLWKNTPPHMIVNKAFVRIADERLAELERSYAKEALDLRAGDMLIFHGGRIWHRVSAVKGERPRITVGGFAAFSNDDSSLFYWS